MSDTDKPGAQMLDTVTKHNPVAWRGKNQGTAPLSSFDESKPQAAHLSWSSTASKKSGAPSSPLLPPVGRVAPRKLKADSAGMAVALNAIMNTKLGKKPRGETQRASGPHSVAPESSGGGGDGPRQSRGPSPLATTPWPPEPQSASTTNTTLKATGGDADCVTECSTVWSVVCFFIAR